MKRLIDYLNKTITDEKFFEPLECSDDEIAILRFLIESFISSKNPISVNLLLESIFGGNGYGYLAHLKEIRNLHELGYIELSYGAIIERLPQNGTMSNLEFLHANIDLSQQFLYFIESNFVKKDFPTIKEYKDHFDYLKDSFELLFYYQRRSFVSDCKKAKFDQTIAKLEEIIEKKISLTKVLLPLEALFKEYKLNKNEKIIFLALLKEEYSEQDQSFREQNSLLSLISKDELERIENRALLRDDGNLISSGLIDYDEFFSGIGNIKKSFFINEEIVDSLTTHPKKGTKQNKKILLENSVKESEIFELLTPTTTIDDVVLPNEIKELLKNVLKQLDKDVIKKLNSWGIKARRGIDAKILFYGPAGTGKTMSALSLAKSLKKPVLSFDCSRILSKYVGESEQNVRKIFDDYKMICQKTATEPLLLLNEADQFLSARLEMGSSSSDKMHNQMQNIFLEQIENFSGVLVATTNLLKSLDSAFSRRFDYKIEFKKPDFKERLAIWQNMINENMSFEEDFNLEELARFELTGAQIALCLKNTAINVAIRGDDVFRLSDFKAEIKRELRSSFEDEEKKVGLL
ncbi:ATP-binding protein [uncultured Campylobacter sp.]|uniref:ATP-binding protein n=1 Tax=uncultured Campylobacter sp. TaxID=218934 RepID=UPI002612B127|nr:ATP-binding protein [uncultured Campylobacter sp.]